MLVDKRPWIQTWLIDMGIISFMYQWSANIWYWRPQISTRFCLFSSVCIFCLLEIRVIYLHISIRVTSLTMGQSYSCHSASEMAPILANCLYTDTTKHDKGQTLRIFGMYKSALLWRHNGRGSVSNHQPHDCILNRLFRRRSKKTPKLRVTGLCAGNSPVTDEFPAQKASYAENFSVWWRHHGVLRIMLYY